jgi:hypothetical protein
LYKQTYVLKLFISLNRLPSFGFLVLKLYIYFFKLELGVELWGLELAMTSALFQFVIFQTGSCFMLQQVWTPLFLLMLPTVTGMAGACLYTQLLVEMLS